VVSARMHGPSGVALRRTIAGQVAEIERIAHRLALAGATASNGSCPAPTPEAIDRITEHLDALDAARAELARLEADAGLDLRF